MLFPVAQIETLGAEDGYNIGSFMSLSQGESE